MAGDSTNDRRKFEEKQHTVCSVSEMFLAVLCGLDELTVSVGDQRFSLSFSALIQATEI
jgi:hypothetical protein